MFILYKIPIVMGIIDYSNRTIDGFYETRQMAESQGSFYFYNFKGFVYEVVEDRPSSNWEALIMKKWKEVGQDNDDPKTERERQVAVV